MNKFSRALIGLLVPAFLVVATPAMAQEAKAEKKMAKAGEVQLKEITQNDKLRVYEATFKPGDMSAAAKRPMRVVRALKGGMLERIYEDGTKETVQWKTGEARILSEERSYAVKNVGKSVVHLYIVQMK